MRWVAWAVVGGVAAFCATILPLMIGSAIFR